MYAAVDDKDNVIAWHEDKEVVSEFIYNHLTQHKESYQCHKIKKKKLKNLEDRYLVPVGHVYIPVKYQDIYDINNDDRRDLQLAKDIILKLAYKDDLSHKDIKTIKNIALLLDRYIEDIDDYQPSNKELVTMEDMFAQYEYNTNYY